MSIVTWLVGPLSGLECRRALARGWLILARTLAALAILVPTLVILWTWWMWLFSDPSFSPYHLFRTGLFIVETMMVTVAFILSPAVLAGSLAGERERGSLGLLLTTQVTPYEIVCGRFTGKLTQIGMILLAGVPPLVLFNALAGLSLSTFATLLALPAAVAWGGAGLATAVSAVSKRGRDALLSVYLIDLIFLLAPMAIAFVTASSRFEWLGLANPYAGLTPLFWQEKREYSLISIAFWFILGVIGLAIASWRLVPSSLRRLDGPRTTRRSFRRGRIRPVDEERPMVWKELYIERGVSLGGFGWWLGAGLTLLLAGGSLLFLAINAWEFFFREGELTLFLKSREILQDAVAGSGVFVTWLITWAIGLRAAVTISSERERGTWDAILTSPLESREILRAKLWGCLYALRWLFFAAVLSWTVAAAVGAITWMDYAGWVLSTIVGGAFMAVAGLRASLANETATRAMAVTIGAWLLAQIGFRIVAALLLALIAITVLLTVSALTDQPITQVLSLNGDYGPIAWLITFQGVSILITLLFLSYTRVLFDRLAGRRAEGRVAILAEELLHGDASARNSAAAFQRSKSQSVEAKEVVGDRVVD